MIKRHILTWNDFIDVSMNEASGNVSVLDTPTEGLPEIYFFANGIDWTTEDPADLDAFEDVGRGRDVAPHQGLQLIPGHPAHPGRLRAQPGLERRRSPGPDLGGRSDPGTSGV